MSMEDQMTLRPHVDRRHPARGVLYGWGSGQVARHKLVRAASFWLGGKERWEARPEGR